MNTASFQVMFQSGECFFPERARSLFAPFSMDEHFVWTAKSKVSYIEVDEFLDPHSRVVEQAQ
jgi:hypothetical protein